MRAGQDALGAYREISFAYRAGTRRRGTLRLYLHQPVVLFTDSYTQAARNGAPFPTLTRYPRRLDGVSYGGPTLRSTPWLTFTLSGADGPWLLFDRGAPLPDAMILSPASDFLIAHLSMPAAPTERSALVSGIISQVATLPAGFTHQTILVVGRGIANTFAVWGRALLALHGKRPLALDATVSLRTLGYWTDHGAAYWYAFPGYDRAGPTTPQPGYTRTLLRVRDEFTHKGLALGYLEADSWWYPKGRTANWQNYAGGVYTYTAAPALFPRGLGAFQRQLGLPLIVHGRWIDPASPYRQMFSMAGRGSGAQRAYFSTDPRFWNQLAAYLRGQGAMAFEQDWFALMDAPAASSLRDQPALMEGMATAAARRGLGLLFAGPAARQDLQSTLVPTLSAVRVSDDRFDPSQWDAFLYGSQLVRALGVYPWTDVFFSGETTNLLLATLSAGMVGVGDPLGTVQAATLLQAVRPDGVIVKPDVPIVPVDAMYLSDARRAGQPMVAWTYSDHGGLRVAYVFAYSRWNPAASAPSPFPLAGAAWPSRRRHGAFGPPAIATFVPAAFVTPASTHPPAQVYVYDYFHHTGRLVAAGARVTIRVQTGSYSIVAPVGRSGIAFLGDTGQFASLGRQRIAYLDDTGVVHTTILFAAGERVVAVQGYAPRPPQVQITTGVVRQAAYERASHLFRLIVGPARGGHTCRLSIRTGAGPAQ
jgi:hypothetical protein